MKDLEIWRRLHADPIVVDEGLFELLAPLADSPTRVVGPFAAALTRCLGHEDPRVRSLALRAFAGASGHAGLQALIKGLDDEDGGVREAAVRALAASARAQPARWAHAIFHPRSDVRAMALAADTVEPAAKLGIYLLADPDNKDLARAAPWPEDSLPLAFDLFARGKISAAMTTARMAHTRVPALRNFLLHGQRRSELEVDAWLDRCLSTGALPAAGGTDLLDLWCLAWTPGSPGAAQALTHLREAVLGHRLPRLRRRAAVALLHNGAAGTRGEGGRKFNEDGLDICVACEPRVLALDALSVARRQKAARVLLDRNLKLPKVSEARVAELWNSGACVRDAGPLGALPLDAPLHLSTAACVAALLPRRRVCALIAHYGAPAVVQVVAHDNQAWMDLCRLPQESKGGALLLLDRFRRKDRPRYEQLLALAIGTWITSEAKRANEAIARRLRGSLSTQVLRQCVELMIAGELSLSEAHANKLGARLVAKVPDTDLSSLIAWLMDKEGQLSDALIAFLLRKVGERVEPTAWALATCGLPADALRYLFDLLEHELLVPHEHQLALARALNKHAEPDMRRWSRLVLHAGAARRAPAAKRAAGQRLLSDAQLDAIATCPTAELGEALVPALESPTGWLCRGLAAREATPNLLACTALVGCVDAPQEVARELERFAPDADDLSDLLHASCVRTWQGRELLPPLANAMLHRWEVHAFAFGEWFEGKGESRGQSTIRARLTEIGRWPGTVAKRIVWEAVASLILLRLYREPEFMAAYGCEELVRAVLPLLDTHAGPAAAKVLRSIFVAGVAEHALLEIEPEVRDMGPDLDAATRLELSRWIRFDGLAPRRSPVRRIPGNLQADVLGRIRGSEDLDMLEILCRRGDTRIVHEACLRLVMLGRKGQLRVLSLLGLEPALSGVEALADSVALWDDAGCVAAVRVMAADPRLACATRFRLCIALGERGERGFIEHALGVLRQPVGAQEWGWFGRQLRRRLLSLVNDDRRVALALADSEHPHAYRKAVHWVLEHAASAGPDGATTGGFEDGELTAALQRFLAAGSQRPRDLRRKVAMHLAGLGHTHELVPIALVDLFDPEFPNGKAWMKAWPREAGELLLRAALDAALGLGADACTESRVLEMLDLSTLDAHSAEAHMREIMAQGVIPGVRSQIVRRLEAAGARERKAKRVAAVFAWGVRRGRELTGRVMKIHMTDRRADFGYTFLDQSKIYVSALPIFRGDRHGLDIVEGLILHELGHHMYHAGKANDVVWRRAQREGLHRLLNLVADEHLERNLRALEPEYGDRLKRLCAYAFAHSSRELQVAAALNMLLGAAFEVLSAEPLGVAFDPDCVQVERGALLRELDRRGHGFARFVRALRMGLGARHEDPQLQAALQLFRGGFRHKDMAGLYEIVLKLAEIYGGSQGLAQVFGGHEDLEWEGRDAEAHNSGVEDEQVQREVERILDPKRRSGKPNKGGGRLAINVAEDAHFDIIEKVERVAADRAKHAAVAKELRRFSNRLREYMAALGLSHQKMRARLQGRAFDRTRAQAVVIRRDPRMLVARQLRRNTDLFVGVVVDCSGSMSVGGSMDKAHRFGVLIAEAVARLEGVDARFFGFTDSTIFDAGDAEHCAVTSLEPTGGNNDAAGLWHAARAASASARRAKLLVMISDGLPTECSVQALRGLVQQLGRKGMVCAQVAVRPLEEVCFPHYVVLDDEDMNASVRKFGEIITRLVGRALGR